MKPRLMCLFAITLALSAAEGSKRPVSVTTTEHFAFAADGTIRIDGSFGYVTVEAWDLPEVQIAITKVTDQLYDPAQQAEAKRRLDLIRIAAERRSGKELVITTIRPSHHRTWAPPLRAPTSAGVTVEYRIMAPRNSHLVIHHDWGYVWVDDITGEIEANSHTGDLTVMVPDGPRYSIDARSRVGDIDSDFDGIDRSEFLVGERFRQSGEAPSQRLFLRMGRGKISIRRVRPDGQAGEELRRSFADFK